jgi:hypothetical protein
MKLSKAERAVYLKSLRSRWAECKALADSSNDIKALYAAASATGTPIQSFYSFSFVALQMQAQGLNGFPYVDMKTFQGWKENGFKVRKGEHSTADGIVWIGAGCDRDDQGNEIGEPDFMFPKVYKLFHRQQVE